MIEQKKPYSPPAMTPINDLISQVYPTTAVQPAAVESVATSVEAPGLPTPSTERAAELLPRGTPQPAPQPQAKRLVLDHNPFEYFGYGNPEFKSTCRVRVWIAERRDNEHVPELVVLISELAGNQGIGITAGIVQIASLILPELMPGAEYRAQARWVEHHQVEGAHTFDVVTFSGYDAHGPIYARNRWGTMFSGPYWHRITRREFESWIGAEVEL